MKYLYTLLFSVLIVHSYTQTSIGLRTGMGFYKHTVDNEYAFEDSDIEDWEDSKTGIYIAIPVEFKLTNILSIQPELTYASKGTKAEGEISEFELTENYLELPVFLKLNIDFDFFGLEFLGGFYGSYALSGKTEGMIGGIEINRDIEFDEKKDGVEYTRTDYGFKIGGGLHFNLNEEKTSRLFANTLLDFGMHEIYEDVDGVNNSGMVLSAGILFNL